MEHEIPIGISDVGQVGGTYPLVVIGPNGSGKTKFGVQVATDNDADMIGALRNIQMGENIGMRSVDQASNELRNSLQRRRSRYWEMSNEIDQLFSKLLGENSQSAIRFRNEYLQDGTATPERTKLMILTKAWAQLFPGRTIDFTSYSPKVQANLQGDNAEYLAQQMSDGERVAVYLAGRVLDSDKSIIIIDEPEVHFHNRLAVKFWNKLEELRPDCRFVYITHDIVFALSRQLARYLVIQPNKPPELLPLDSELPRSIMQSILSAASFSIFARRIIFCEGDDRGKRDYTFYSSWFNDKDTAIIPVGSCTEVIQCTTAFGNDRVVTGVSSIGIIDRDYWPDDFLSSLSPEVHPLPVHEVENIYCLRGVFEAIGNHLSLSTQQINDRYTEFLQEAKALFTGGLSCKQISERVKRRYERQFYEVVNTLDMSDNVAELQAHYSEAMRSGNWRIDPDSIFSEENEQVRNALTSSEEAFLRVLPGKSFYSIAARKLGLTSERYTELVHSALASETDSGLFDVGQSLEQVLSPLLPPRRVEETETQL